MNLYLFIVYENNCIILEFAFSIILAFAGKEEMGTSGKYEFKNLLLVLILVNETLCFEDKALKDSVRKTSLQKCRPCDGNHLQR